MSRTDPHVKKHQLLASAVIPSILVLASPALATTVSGASSTPLATSSAGDVTIASGGTLSVPGGTAVTVNSPNSATVASGGTIAVGSANGATAIAISPGLAGTVENDGTITVAESYTAPDTNGNGIAAGPIALASNRAGILAGAGASGSIANTGSITVEGLNSGGIILAGPFGGSLSNTGTIAMKGDGSAGVSTAAVSGDVTLGGTISVVGQGARAVLLGSDIGGALTLAGTINQLSSYTTDAGTTQFLSRSALKTGTPAVEIDGNVAKGILVYAPCTVTTVGSANSCTPTGSTIATAGAISSVGDGPAIQIGGPADTSIGTATSIDGNAYGLVVDGSVTGTASYSSTDAFGVVVGGKGGNVSMPGGIGVSGTLSATTLDSSATALLINAGSTVPSLTNTGTISAIISSPGQGASYAIRDLSGSLASIANHGFITVTGTSEDTTAAIDLSANTTGVRITQSLTPYEQAEQSAEQAASGYNPATAKTYSAITGNILTGSGNDLIAVSTGKVMGSAWLGGGSDTVNLSGDAAWTGDLHFGPGTATIGLAGSSRFTGGLFLADQPTTLTIGGNAAFAGTGTTGASQLAVVVNGGSFGAGSVANLSVSGLTVNAGGSLRAYIDGTAGTSSLVRASTATFAPGSTVSATITSLSNAVGTYHVLSAGTLTGSPAFDATATGLPLLFTGAVSEQGNDIYLTVAHRSLADLGLNSAQTQAFNAIYANAIANSALGTSLLQSADLPTLQGQINALLPDHEGGVFDFLTRAGRLATRHVTDDSSLFNISDVGGWLEPMVFRGGQHSATTAWDDDGFGLSGGLERASRIGNLGISVMWSTGFIHDGSWERIRANTYEIGAFWRLSKGPLYAFAKVSADRISLSSQRIFNGTNNGAALTYDASGKWAGWGFSGAGGLSYKVQLPGHFSLKPMEVLDYWHLSENGYAESGAVPIDLAVSGRNSNVSTATSTLTAAWSAGPSDHDGRSLTIEIEGGRRSILSGDLGATTASYLDGSGSPFVISPEAQKGGWLGEARISIGGADYTWQFAAGAQQTVGKPDLSARASLSMAL